MTLITHNARHAARRSALGARRFERGATLLEFIIYIGVISLVLTTATLFAMEMLHAQSKARALSEVVRNARFAASRLEIEIREAADVNVGASVFDTDPGTLSLATSTPATDPTIFAVSAGALTIKQGTGAAMPLTNAQVEVQEFTVENVGTPNRTRAIRLHLKVRAKSTGSLVSQTADTTVESTVRIQAKDGFGN